MRLFVGIDIDEAIRQRIVSFVQSVREAAPKARWVKPDTFHVTLKFLGETTKDREVIAPLHGVHLPGPQIRFCGTGFFPNPRSARVFWIGIEADERLPSLAAAVDEAVANAGFEREAQRYKPHLTLARGGSRASGNPHQRAPASGTMFGTLQERLKSTPELDFGTMQAQEFCLYESKLSPAGARYIKVARFPLD